MRAFSAAAATLIIAVLCGVTIQAAEAADTVRVRGTVESIDGSELTVKTREGNSTAIKLNDNWKVIGVVKASIDDIKPGDFVGIASLPKSRGGDGAVEVLIFPAAMKGTGEGSYPWDLKPNSTMTNATVSNAVKDVDGRNITVNFHGKEKTISVAEGTVIVTFGPAAQSDLKPGMTVFVPSQKADDGTLSAANVVAGTNGVAPPM
ncbi:DUF5666 domain-containing protein [Bradyrhizobium sp. BR13661]|jgi:hypothetical protein|uniref:DUF5666 domain-containing protein n=1 Tax=Bradyrhizobium sp. BR13661 TaxID=2940622 RepID=UPI002476F5A8|nr:DUF5666 domain-containing protein [Bradyrhizobium sp. BR13661]MDH6262059.1 hypothetical protein [Bradyrhizobium sp. BR13661]